MNANILFFKTAMVRKMSNMNQDYLIEACRQLRSHIEAAIEAECGFIE